MNRNKKIRFWNGIRFRISAALLLLVAACGTLLYLAVMGMTQRNMENQLISDLQKLSGSTEVYVRQILMLNNQNNDENGFSVCASEIAEELYSTSKNQMVLFTTDGAPLLCYGYPKTVNSEALYLEITSQEAYANALSGQASYSLSASFDDRYEVWFVMPLRVAGKEIGMVSYHLDYSAQYAQYNRIMRMILNITTITLLIITCMVLLLLTGILRPIQKLSRISSRVAADIRDNRVSTGNLVGKSLTRRKDEIGQLARDYNLMLKTVENQFTKIQEDRDNILQLLSSRQEFYNNVTHELKTPLTTVKGYAQLLEDDNMQDEALYHTALAHIQHESSRLHQMVIQLLEMSNREIHTRMTPVNAAAVLASVAASMSLKAHRYNNEILTDGPPSVVILGNEERIRELFINLIDNAIKYGTSGRPIRTVIHSEADDAVIQIINEGPGITEASLEHIFDPFFREDKERSRELGSSGLGLSICKKIVEEHHGTISVKSVPDRETVFILYLPLYKEDSDQ